MLDPQLDGLERGRARAFQELRAPAASGASRSRTSSAARASGAIELEVDARVLIPRPETEHARRGGAGPPAGRARGRRRHGLGRDRARAQADERPDLRVTATDAQRGRAGRRAGQRGTARARRSSSAEADLLAGSPTDRRGRLQPAVRARPATRSLAPEDRPHEPRAGAGTPARDGLDVIRAPRRRRGAERRGVLALEVGAGQAAAVAAMLARLASRSRCCATSPGSTRVVRRRTPGWTSDAMAFERCIAAGGVALFPADTVYGLACDPEIAGAGPRAVRAQGPAGGASPRR